MSIKTFILGVSTAAAITAASAVAVAAATIDLGFALDESGSVDNSEFALIRNGLAAAMGKIPSVGAANNPNTYRVTIVQFSDTTNVLVPPTVIDDASRAAIQGTLTANNRAFNDFTGVGEGIQALTNVVCPGGCTGDTTLFNVSLDGDSNTGLALGTAVANATAAGVTGISYEAIGGQVSTGILLAASTPGTPVLVNQASDLPDPTKDGFVFQIGGFSDYEAAISAKVGRIVIDTGGGSSPIPLPAGLPLLLAGLGALTVLRRRASS